VQAFAFIVMDGNGSLYGTVQGSNREVLHKFSVDLPKKHGRGGQSALRFARLRLEKRHNYVRKVAEFATHFFIDPATSKPNVQVRVWGCGGVVKETTETHPVSSLFSSLSPNFPPRPPTHRASS